jgi:hypothetical protein
MFLSCVSRFGEPQLKGCRSETEVSGGMLLGKYQNVVRDVHIDTIGAR